MLLVAFSIAVEKDRTDEVRDILMEDFGVEIVNEYVYEEALCWSKPEQRTYFECFAPFKRMEALTEYLDNTFAGIAILSY